MEEFGAQTHEVMAVNDDKYHEKPQFSARSPTHPIGNPVWVSKTIPINPFLGLNLNSAVKRISGTAESPTPAMMKQFYCKVGEGFAPAVAKVKPLLIQGSAAGT